MASPGRQLRIRVIGETVASLMATLIRIGRRTHIVSA
jgi:hypothetical protein